MVVGNNMQTPPTLRSPHVRPSGGIALILAALSLFFALGMLTTHPSPVKPALPAAPIPAFKHIFVIVLENRGYEELLGSSQAPYLNALAHQYALADNYYAIYHPSLPNYLALTGGDTFGVSSDCTDCFVNAPNLLDQLEAAHKSWKAYMESMPGPCFVGDAPPLYQQKHDPFIYYDNIRTNAARCRQIVPFTEFATDLQADALPDFIWITPNMCNDGHDCPISTTESWLRTWVSAITQSPAWEDDGVLFITFDEGKRDDKGVCCQYAHGGRVITLVVSPLVQPGFRSPIAYDHYALLRTIEAAWGLPPLGKANCDCSPTMADFFSADAPR